MTIRELINLPAAKKLKASKYDTFDEAYAAAHNTRERFELYCSSALTSKKSIITSKPAEYYVTEDGRMFYTVRIPDEGNLCLLHELDPITMLSNQQFARCWYDGVNLNRTTFEVANERNNRRNLAEYGVWLTTASF